MIIPFFCCLQLVYNREHVNIFESIVSEILNWLHEFEIQADRVRPCVVLVTCHPEFSAMVSLLNEKR